MKTSRLEAFSDGVLAIIITIMVLELKVPEGDSLDAIIPLLPRLLTYVLSFIYLGIYWNNHHHLMHTASVVNGKILWANLHLLFWLSLLPFATGFMGENHFETIPTALYGLVLMMSGVAWAILVMAIKHNEESDAGIHDVYPNHMRHILSILGYGIGVGVSFFYTPVALSIYILLAMVWFIPSKTAENILNQST